MRDIRVVPPIAARVEVNVKKYMSRTLSKVYDWKGMLKEGREMSIEKIPRAGGDEVQAPIEGSRLAGHPGNAPCNRHAEAPS
jgi:hypothetical protein